jgi:hypothetical protein
MTREHELEVVARPDGSVVTYLNGKKAKIRWLNIHSSVKHRQTEVTLEILHEPLTVVGDDVKSYVWHLSPCKVVGALPAVLFR